MAQVGRNFLTGARGKHNAPTSATERKPAVRIEPGTFASGHTLSLGANLDRIKPAVSGPTRLDSYLLPLLLSRRHLTSIGDVEQLIQQDEKVPTLRGGVSGRGGRVRHRSLAACQGQKPMSYLS